MKRPWVDKAWRLAVGLFAEALNPLLVIWLALFVSLGYMMTLLMPMRGEHWAGLLIVTLLVSLTGLLRFATPLGNGNPPRPPHSDGGMNATPLGPPVGSGGSLSPSRAFHWRALLPLLPLLIFVPLFVSELTSPEHQIMNHVEIHSSYVYDLLLRESRVENVYMAGHPANYIWLYHAPLAGLMWLTGLPSPMLASFINVIVVCSSFWWLSEVIVDLGLARRRTLHLGLLVMVVYCAVNLTGAFSLAGAMLDGSYDPGSMRVMLLPGADRHLHSVMGKVMNYNSVAIGILAFIVALRVTLQFADGKLDRRGLALASASLILCMAMRQIMAIYIGFALAGGLVVSAIVLSLDRRREGRIPHLLALCAGLALFIVVRQQATMYIGFALAASFALACLVLARDKRSYREGPIPVAIATLRGTGLRYLAAWLLASLCLALPLLHYALQFSGGYGSTIGINTWSGDNNRWLLMALLLPLPLVALQTVYAHRSRSWTAYALQVACWLGLALNSVLTLHLGNQYKAVYVLSILVALSALLGLQNVTRRFDERGGRQLALWLAGLLALLVFIKVFQVGRAYDVTATEWDFAYDGQHIAMLDGPTDMNRYPAYKWLRDHAPVEAVVALPQTTHRYEHALYARRSYARERQFGFTAGIAEHDLRTQHLARFYGEPMDAEAGRQLSLDMQALLPGRALYAVVLDSELSPDEMEGRGAAQAFRSDEHGVGVWLLNP